MEASLTTLFERIGGADAISTAVDRFYEKVLADDRIRHFFEAVNMEFQAQHQKAFLTYAFGGAPEYTGRAMRSAHRNLVRDKGLNDEHFDAVLEILAATLKELGISDDLIAEATVIAESTRDDVLNR